MAVGYVVHQWLPVVISCVQGDKVFGLPLMFGAEAHDLTVMCCSYIQISACSAYTVLWVESLSAT